MHPHHRTDFVYAVAASIHHDIRINTAFVGLNRPCVILVLGEGGHIGVAVHFGASFARMKGKRLTQLCGINVTVFTVPKTTEQVVRGNKRMAARALFCVDHFILNTHPPRHGCEMAIALHLRFGVGKTNAAVAMMVAHRILRVVA